MKELPNYLGGHANITHTDEGLLKYFITQYNIESFLDIGCGPGGMVRLAKAWGLRARGIDGDFTLDFGDVKRYITINDFTKNTVDMEGVFDLGWSVEFLEHVAEEYLENVFDVFRQCRFIMCTASTDGKNHYHLNAQQPEYWIDKFEKNGFTFLKNEMPIIKEKSTMKRDFIKNTGMFFRNNEC